MANFAFTVAHLPRLLGPDAVAAGRGYARIAVASALDVVIQDLRATAPGTLAASYQPHVENAGDRYIGHITSTHPGAAPLEFGATWPGKMPPWSPRSKLSFPGARTLKQRGLAARHYVQTAIDGHQGEIAAILADRGVRAWLRGLMG